MDVYALGVVWVTMLVVTVTANEGSGYQFEGKLGQDGGWPML